MNKRLTQALLRLASLTYQEKYIINGTPDEYVLPEDLVEDVVSLIDLTLKMQENMSEDLREFLKKLKDEIQRCGKLIFNSTESLSATQLIYHDKNWQSLRELANNILCTQGVNTSLIKPAEIDTM